MPDVELRNPLEKGSYERHPTARCRWTTPKPRKSLAKTLVAAATPWRLRFQRTEYRERPLPVPDVAFGASIERGVQHERKQPGQAPTSCERQPTARRRWTTQKPRKDHAKTSVSPQQNTLALEVSTNGVGSDCCQCRMLPNPLERGVQDKPRSRAGRSSFNERDQRARAKLGRLAATRPAQTLHT